MKSSTDLREQWIAWRNGVIGSPRFQRFAARSPFLRPVARRRARTLFDLVAGFTYSQLLAACIETRLLDHLRGGPRGADDLAARIGLPADAAERLLRTAEGLGLVERLDQRWALGSEGAALLGNPGIAEMVAHHRLLYADLADPLALLRRGGGGGALSRHWHYAEASGAGDAAAVAPYSALMAASQPMVAAQALAAYRFDRHARVLDIGGGEGAFLSAVARAVPELDRGLFDLPAVGERSRARLGDGVAIHRGDFLTDPLPTGYDLITLIRVLHDHDDVPAMQLLRAVRAALPPGGTLLIAEPMAGTRGAGGVGSYFELYLLAMGSGRPRTMQEIGAMLREAGFRRVRPLRTPLPLVASAVTARP
ncbi:methyltransferase [Sphingomonas spermidinifaciens]|uniref:Methyltransferase n=1 Tax=Sphingomonas spermidinifaciens TaxID=1141889 RepID=A0A2A4B7K6_9SPHN|nr:methyltransferase [Sphingomonas spermidinifaciens]PCD03624.1 methyltransferase [Sphingomonas spermidinifaciens]